MRKRAIVIHALYILIDICCVAVAVWLACQLRKSALPFEPTLHNIFVDYKNPFTLVFYMWFFAVLFFNNTSGLYQTHRELIETMEVWKVIKSVSLAGIVAIVTIFVLKAEGFPRSIILITYLQVCVFLSVWRVLKRGFVEFLVSQGYNNFNVIIIGAGKVGGALAKEIKARPGYGLKIVGYLDDFKPAGTERSGVKVIGKIADFYQIARKEFVTKIFITIHHDSKVFMELLEQARNLKIAVRVIPQGFEFTTGEFTKYNIGFIPILEYCNEEHLIKQFGKCFFDCVVSLITLILLSPVLLFISVLIKLDSPGPVFYLSKRYGRRGRIFHMYKFRSMVHNADQALSTLREKNEVDGPIFKIKGDPRKTRLGNYLRRYSLDELPQLFNVLRGEMSLVGPRPLPIEQIEKEDLKQLKRLEVRPGITGLWQIRGRSDISFSRLVRWDVWYINNWSFWLDLNILLQTIPVVVRGRGAY